MCYSSWSISLAALCIFLVGLGSGLSSPPPADSEVRAYQTLEGIFNYYWKPDSLAKTIKFVFVCGQVGGWGTPHDESSCSCNDQKSCVNCYRWYDAVTLESVATYGIYLNTKNHSDMAQVMFDHSPYNAKWNAKKICTFIDDFSWYAIAYLRVYEWLEDTVWLNRTLDLYDWLWKYGWDGDCGGFWWSTCETSNFKDSITIVEILHLTAKLAHMFPNASRYAKDATRIWNWFFHFDNGYGLMSDKYLVSTGAIPEKCCNATSHSYSQCHNTRLSGTSYNQGLLMSASAYLYLSTGNASYLKTGLRLLDAVLENYTTSEGILVDEPRSYQSFAGACWAGADPGGDWYSFNGIFMLHLGYFVDLLSKNGTITSQTLARVKSLVDNTSDAAWNRSAVMPPFDGTDGCDIGVDPINATFSYPKFHWWWGKDETLQLIPPDPKLFFHRRKLACVATKGSYPLWKGHTTAEKLCMEKCRGDPKCSKYQFKLGLKKQKGKINCWLWSYNRSDHSCQHKDPNFNIGIKRPVGNVTCSAKCGSKQPQVLGNGGVCYCSEDCAAHMDCCLDYADHCNPPGPILCKGNCTDVIPRPIPQGGYCWCFDGCNGWFTDNNSDGSCCSDYPQECIPVDIPVCLDGRTQVSALSLFLAQTKLNQLFKK